MAHLIENKITRKLGGVEGATKALAEMEERLEDEDLELPMRVHT